MTRVVIVHGWSGTPDTGWFPWLKGELEKEGVEVIVPQLPERDTPHIQSWVPALAEAVGTADTDTYFIGHSMGCQTIVRYIETLPEGVQVGGAVFIAGFFRPLTGLDAEDLPIDKEWAETTIDFEKVRSHLGKSIAVFSDDDPYVPVENAEDFKKRLGSDIRIEHAQNHFNESSGFDTLPLALESLRALGV